MKRPPFLRRAPAPFEQSRALRIAVLATTLWGYLTLGLVSDLIPIALVAAILTCLGHWSSYRSSGRQGILRRLLIGGGLAAVVLWVLVDISTGIAGARLPQAQLGMLVQAVTSFELRTRRNLYATTLHTLAVMYLASNFGFSLVFGLLLAGFAAGVVAIFAIATLEDKRRASRPFRIAHASGGWVFWSLFAAASLGLTVLFTLSLPRPISSGLFSPLTLTLPFSAPAQPQTVEPLVPFIQLNSTGAAGGLEPTVDMSFRGQFNEAVAFHVRTPVRSYWRGLAFDRYTGRTWDSTAPEKEVQRDPRGSYDVSGQGIRLDPDSQYVQTFYIMRDQGEVVPVGYDPVSVIFRGELPSIRVTSERSVKRGDPLRAGTSYSVISQAMRSRGITGNGLNNGSLERYKGFAPSRRSPIARLAADVVGRARTPLQKAARIEEHLRESYIYDLNIPPLPPGADAVEQFLFVDKAGFCTQFASAMVVMLRHQDVAARLVTGFGPGEHNAFTGLYTVRASDAHAWVEVWSDDPRSPGWVPFDPTPRYDGIRDRPDNGMLSATLLDRPVIGQIQGLIGGGLLTIGGGLGALLLPIAAGLAAGLIVAGIWFLWRGRWWPGLRRRLGPPDDRAIVLDAYRRAGREVEPAAGPRRASQTPAEYLAVAVPRLADRSPAFAELTQLAERAAYDPRSITTAEADRARTCLRAVRRRRGSRGIGNRE